jgi:hypothetical protein
MDFFLDALAELQHTVFFSVANLLNLEVDLILFDYPADPEDCSAVVWV